MKLREFKEILNKLSDKELDVELIYNSEDYYMSGKVTALKKANSNFYYTGEDDPAPLYTKSQLKENGYDNEDIEEFEIEIPKGSWYIEF